MPPPNFDVEDMARWLEEFHPHSLVELDYGGLVHLMDDDALQADQSVAELSAALTGLDTGQEELAYRHVSEGHPSLEVNATSGICQLNPNRTV